MSLISPSDLSSAMTKLETNLSRLDSIVNGASTADVVVDSGTVPTVSKALANILAVSPVRGYATIALMNADLVPSNGAIAYCTETDNFYQKDGDSGSGGWTLQAQTVYDYSIYKLMTASEISSRDITNALTRSETDLDPGMSVYIPSGDWSFTSPMTFARQRLGLKGAGMQNTRLYYTGTATGADLMTFGDDTNTLYAPTIGGFFISSQTTMTDGAAIKCNKIARALLDGLSFDDQDSNGTGNLWDALWLNGLDNVSLTRFLFGNNARLNGTACRVNGLTSGWKADLFMAYGKITGWDKGVHIGGAFGGFFGDMVDVIGNNTNVTVDESWVSEANREMNFGPDFAADSAYLTNMVVNQSGAGYITLTGTWLASAIFSDDATDNLRIESFPNGIFNWTGGRCLNANRDGIRILDKTTRVTLGGALMIDGCAESGINLEPDDPDDATGIYNPYVVIGSEVRFNANNTNVNPTFCGPHYKKFWNDTLDTSGALNVDHGISNLPGALVSASAMMKGNSGEAAPIAMTVDGTQVHITGGTAGRSVRILIVYLADTTTW